MLHHILPFLLIGLLLVAFAIIAGLLRRLSEANLDASPSLDFSGYQRKRYIFSAAEYSFYKVLSMAVGGEYSIQVKVRLADLIDVAQDAPERRKKLNKILQKHVDFLLCEPKSMTPVMAIELDDGSHERVKTQQRDAFVNGLMEAVGIPMLRVTVARGYDPAELKMLVSRSLSRKAA